MRRVTSLIILIISIQIHSQSCNITATDLFGNTSVQLNCGNNGCVDLTTNVPSTFLTTSYNVASQSYVPIIPFDQGTPLNANFDDNFSGIIPLPFKFCFYGNSYDNIVISSNGFITFDTTQAGLVSNPNILASNPNALLPKNSIFGIMQDLIFSNTDDSEIYYSVIGNSPCRKFVINFYKARLTGCTDRTSFQIVLSEFSNEIDINIENKPLPCTNASFKESLIGIMNSTGTDGLSPPGRNKDIWQSGNESWKFSPTGKKIEPDINWKDSSNLTVGSKDTIKVCPKKTEKYTVTLDYSVCNNNYKFTDDIDVTFNLTGTPVINSPVEFRYSLCDNNADNTENFSWSTLVTPLITTDPTVTVKYFETFPAAQAGGAGITFVKEGQYTVYARVTDPKGCYSIGEVHMNITFLKKIIAKDIKKQYCFDGTEDFPIDLNELYPEMLVSPISEITKVSYYENQNDATVPNPTAAISPNQIIDEDGNLLTITYFVRFENSDGCYTVKKITIVLQNPIANQSLDICDFGNNGTEDIILNKLNSAIAGDQPVLVSYFPDNFSANANSGAITTYQLTSANSPSVIYVRLDMMADNGNCFRVYPVTLTLIGSPVLTKEIITVNLGDICDNNNDKVESYDLTQHQTEIYSGTDNFNYIYYQNYNAATGTFSNHIADPTKYPINKSTEVYVMVTNGKCFSVAKIILNFNFLPAVIIKPGLIAKCDKGYDYGETYDLNDAITGMFDQSQNTLPISDMKITYFSSKDDANQGSPTINNLQTTYNNTVTFWARFESKSSHCFSVAPIVLKTYFPPKAVPITINVCDDNLDSNPEVNLLLPEYTDKMTSEIDPENHFTFYMTQADILNNNPIKNPENFSPKPFPTRIWVLVENIPGCYNFPSTIDFTFGTPAPINPGPYPLNQCDEGNDGKEILDLTQFENLIYPTGGATYSYYPTLEDLNNYKNKIQTPTSYLYDNNLQSPTIYVNANVAGYCPVLVKINVNLKLSPIFDLPEYYFCPGVGIKIQPDLDYLNPKDFTWKNPAGEIISKDKYIEDIKIQGKYSLTITAGNDCKYTDYFDVIAYEVPVIQQLLALGATSYQVIATGSRKIVYSIDSIHWQESNIFENLTPGPVTFYVRFEDSDCIGEPKSGLSVKVLNVITPNNDGINDFWTFKDLNVFKDIPSNLKIYDRNGVLIYEQSSSESFKWNGKNNGRSLPTASYWYKMTLPDKVITGWILLKNAN